MALGYENTGIAPGLISKAGSAMAESIRQTGEKIRGDIIQHNTDRQVVGLLNDAKTLNVASPTFQTDLIGVLGRYPMALGDQRSQIGLSLLGQAWKQQKEDAQSLTSFNRQKDLIDLRNKNRNGLAADLPPLNLGDTPEMPQGGAGEAVVPFGAGNQGGVMGRFGAGGGQGMQFGAGMRDQGGEGFGTPERELPNDLPPIPEPGMAQGNPLFDTDRVLRGIPGLDRTTYAKTMARTAERDAAAKITAGKPLFRGATSDIVMLKPDGSSEVVFKADPKTKSVFVTQEGEPYQQLSDGKWKYPDGSIKDEAPEVGIKRVPGFTEERRAEETERKNLASETAKSEQFQQKTIIQNQRDKRNELEDQRAAYKREFAQKNTTPARKAELTAAVDSLTNNINLLNSRIDELSAARDEEQEFKDEAEARAAGKKTGDIIILINPKTGRPAKARLN